MDNQINKEVVKLLIDEIPKRRGEARKNLIEKTALNWIAYTKAFNIRAFPREHLNHLADDIKPRAKQNLINSLLDYMIKNKLIEENEQVKTLYRWKNTSLESNDGKSFSVLMARNGYKRNLYNQNGNTKTKIKTLHIGEEIKNDFDLSEVRSNKPIEQQGVRGLRSKSLSKEPRKQITIKTYFVL